MVARKRSNRDIGSSKRPKASSSSSKGRLSNSAASAAALAPGRPIITLENFALLPNEIRTKIVELACSLAAAANEDAASNRQATNDTRPPRLDYNTAVSLSRTSRSFHALVTPILMRSVRISRPSALASFSLAVQKQPQLGPVIKSLYVGPEDPLPDWWEPLQTTRDYECSQCSDDWNCVHDVLDEISCSLHGVEERKLLSRSCRRTEPWSLIDRASDQPSSAIFDALQEVQCSIDVDLLRLGRSRRGQQLNNVEWHTRVWEAQAALDLYLMAMRRLEDENGITDANVERQEGLAYPSLVLRGYPASLDRLDDKTSSATAPLVISRSQLLDHLARPHSITDRFDHPLIFLRSGIDITKALRNGFEEEDLRPTPGAWVASLFGSSSSSPDEPLPSAASLSSTLRCLRFVLGQMTRLEDLTLTGFLELAICGSHPTPLSIPTLRRLAIGPPASYDFGPPQLTHFVAVEELWISSIRLHDENELVEVVTLLPRLRRLQVVFGTYAKFPKQAKLFSAIDRLVGGLELVAARLLSTRKVGTISSSEGILTDNGSTSSSGGSSQSSSVRVVEIVMHHVDLKWLLETVASAVGECWKAGRPVTSQSHPISLAVRSTEKHWWVTSAKRTKQMYADGREWLKGHAGGGAG